jgi:hypothetical protein
MLRTHGVAITVQLQQLTLTVVTTSSSSSVCLAVYYLAVATS